MACVSSMRLVAAILGLEGLQVLSKSSVGASGSCTCSGNTSSAAAVVRGPSANKRVFCDLSCVVQ